MNTTAWPWFVVIFFVPLLFVLSGGLFLFVINKISKKSAIISVVSCITGMSVLVPSLIQYANKTNHTKFSLLLPFVSILFWFVPAIVYVDHLYRMRIETVQIKRFQFYVLFTIRIVYLIMVLGIAWILVRFLIL